MSIRMGGLCGGATPAQLDALTRYGEASGLAFQIADDILNATSTPEQLGKPVGSDRERGKLTYVAVHGLERSRARAEDLVREAGGAIEGLPGDTAPLRALAEHAIRRSS